MAFWTSKNCCLRKKIGRGRLNRKKLTSTSTNLTSKMVTWNLTSKTVTSTVKRGVKRGHSIPYHHQQSPPFSKLNSMLPLLWFRFNKPQSFSIFPYSMLIAFPKKIDLILFWKKDEWARDRDMLKIVMTCSVLLLWCQFSISMNSLLSGKLN